MSSRVRPTPPSGLASSKRSVPSHSSQPGSSSFDNVVTKRHGFQSDSRAQEEYYRAVGIKIDEATEPGVSDEDAARYHAMIKKLFRGSSSGNASDGIPPKPENVSAGMAIAQGLRKRLKSSEETAVLNTLIFIDELMRTVPLFYIFISNDKFFRQLWRLVDPEYKEQSIQIPFLTRSKALRAHRMISQKIQERVLILIRAWAETLSEMRLGYYDPKANFYVERYKTKRQRVVFPEVPKTDTPWVCPLPKSLSRNRQTPGRGSSSHSASDAIDFAVTIDEIENSVNLFSSLVDNATSASDLKSELCSELADKCGQISRGMEKFSANLTTDKDLVRAITINDSLQSALTRYRDGLERKDWDQDDAGHIATVSLDSEDDEKYDDGYKKRYDDPLPKFSSLRIRSAETYEAGSSSRGPRMPSDIRIPRRSNTRIDARDDGDDGYSNVRLGGLDNDIADNRDRSRSNYTHDGDHERDVEREDYRELSHVRTRGRGDYDRSRDFITPRQNRKNGSKSSSEADVGGPDSRIVTERDQAPREGRERDRARGPTKSSKAKDTKVDKKSKGAPIRKSEGVASRKRPEKASKAPKKKQAESSTGDDDSVAHDDEILSSSDEWSDPVNEESFKLLAERFKSQKQMRTTKKSNTKSSGKKSNESRKNALSGAIGETSQGASSSGGTGFPQAPVTFGGNGMFAPGMSGMGMNPMMMMGAPMANPFGMYGSLNPMFMPDPMGTFNPYSTVNPAMYYQSMNSNFVPGMTSIGGMGYGNAARGAGNRSLGMGSPESGGHSFSGSGNPTMSVNGTSADQDNQMEQRALAYPSNDTGAPPSYERGSYMSALNNNSYAAGQVGTPNFLNSGWPPEMSPTPGVHSPTPPAPVSFNNNGSGVADPRSSGNFSNPNEGPNALTLAGGGNGLSRQQAERQAAIYQSAMQQAATAYHIAATAYQTMQGQAAFTANETAISRNSNSPSAPEEGESQSPSSAKEET